MSDDELNIKYQIFIKRVAKFYIFITQFKEY